MGKGDSVDWELIPKENEKILRKISKILNKKSLKPYNENTDRDNARHFTLNYFNFRLKGIFLTSYLKMYKRGDLCEWRVEYIRGNILENDVYIFYIDESYLIDLGIIEQLHNLYVKFKGEIPEDLL